MKIIDMPIKPKKMYNLIVEYLLGRFEMIEVAEGEILYGIKGLERVVLVHGGNNSRMYVHSVFLFPEDDSN